MGGKSEEMEKELKGKKKRDEIRKVRKRRKGIWRKKGGGGERMKWGRKRREVETECNGGESVERGRKIGKGRRMRKRGRRKRRKREERGEWSKEEKEGKGRGGAKM